MLNLAALMFLSLTASAYDRPYETKEPDSASAGYTFRGNTQGISLSGETRSSGALLRYGEGDVHVSIATMDAGASAAAVIDPAKPGNPPVLKLRLDGEIGERTRKVDHVGDVGSEVAHQLGVNFERDLALDLKWQTSADFRFRGRSWNDGDEQSSNANLTMAEGHIGAELGVGQSKDKTIPFLLLAAGGKLLVCKAMSNPKHMFCVNFSALAKGGLPQLQGEASMGAAYRYRIADAKHKAVGHAIMIGPEVGVAGKLDPVGGHGATQANIAITAR